MRHSKPDFPVALALEWLGFVDVPHVTGGGYKKMLCPFHPDTHPSAQISRLGFQCFACGESGDAVKLIRREGLSYQSAIAVLKELAGGENRPGPPEREWGQSLLG